MAFQTKPRQPFDSSKPSASMPDCLLYELYARIDKHLTFNSLWTEMSPRDGDTLVIQRYRNSSPVTDWSCEYERYRVSVVTVNLCDSGGIVCNLQIWSILAVTISRDSGFHGTLIEKHSCERFHGTNANPLNAKPTPQRRRSD